jgi:hypothetical protein
LHIIFENQGRFTKIAIGWHKSCKACGRLVAGRFVDQKLRAVAFLFDRERADVEALTGDDLEFTSRDRGDRQAAAFSRGPSCRSLAPLNAGTSINLGFEP